ncbi:MAG: hypothetical protein JW955_04965 [Sedimentisphaerales bacterium]|nr:hypothetical protein [Sedimentisphaerales bacterium]
MTPSRVQIIPFLHGKITRDGKLSEPDIYDILEKWLDRHPEIKTRQRDIQIVRGRWTLPQGVRTEVISVSIAPGEDIAGYDPTKDVDLYEYFLSEDQGGLP